MACGDIFAQHKLDPVSDHPRREPDFARHLQQLGRSSRGLDQVEEGDVGPIRLHQQAARTHHPQHERANQVWQIKNSFFLP